jgi:transcription elongation factor Elf1
MGMYDTILFNCPACNAEIQEQSKAGKCIMKTYSADSIPLNIAMDIDGNDLLCHECGKHFKISLPPPNT